jgi:hypothetical protein
MIEDLMIFRQLHRHESFYVPEVSTNKALLSDKFSAALQICRRARRWATKEKNALGAGAVTLILSILGT